jgi:hypothetical protein
VTACSFSPSAGPMDAPRADAHDARSPDGFVFRDAPADARKLDSSGGCMMTVGRIFPVCLLALPGSGATPTGTIDTDTSSQCAGSNTFTASQDVCLIVGTTLTADGLRATGNRPLVLAATTGNLVIGSNGVDVSSNATAGAAAQASCGGVVSPGNANGDEGGGAGASYGGSGGGGGNGAGNGGTGGGAGPAVAFGSGSTLSGGCPGAAGGGAGGGSGGFGGGAVWMIASADIVIGGVINASGGPGGATSAGSNWGGGGGGAGGLIGFDGTVALSTGAQVFANGGGGGQGCGSATNGNPGNVSTAPNVAGAGGTGAQTHGGDGGKGSVGNVVTGVKGTDGIGGAGGGGGGGGAGIIVVPTGTTGFGIAGSPPQTQL